MKINYSKKDLDEFKRRIHRCDDKIYLIHQIEYKGVLPKDSFVVLNHAERVDITSFIKSCTSIAERVQNMTCTDYNLVVILTKEFTQNYSIISPLVTTDFELNLIYFAFKKSCSGK